MMKIFFTKFGSVSLLCLAFFSVNALATHHKSERLDIVETALSNPALTTLVTAIKAAGLVDTLKGEGPFTVFAPTNQAFVKLSAGTLGDLLRVENKHKLAAILNYHVLSGEITAIEIATLDKAITIQNRVIIITIADGIKVNNANVTQKDIKTKNGIIHLIDTVMLPEVQIP